MKFVKVDNILKKNYLALVNAKATKLNFIYVLCINGVYKMIDSINKFIKLSLI